MDRLCLDMQEFQKVFQLANCSISVVVSDYSPFSSNKLDFVLTPLLTEKKNYREFIVRDQRISKLKNLFIKLSLKMWKTKIIRMTLLIPVRYCPTTQTRYT